jgi:hypothetical protein
VTKHTKGRKQLSVSVAYAAFLVPVAVLLALIWLVIGMPEQIMERAGLVSPSARWTRLALFWSAIALVAALLCVTKRL